MESKAKLVAAVTTSGAVLCLTFGTNDGHATIDSEKQRNRFPELLTLRVQNLADKINGAMLAAGAATTDDVSRIQLERTFEEDDSSQAEPRKIENIVQFFNFYNCFRPGWRNC